MSGLGADVPCPPFMHIFQYGVQQIDLKTLNPKKQKTKTINPNPNRIKENRVRANQINSKKIKTKHITQNQI